MKRYLGISPWRYGGWRNAPNALTPAEVDAIKHAPVKGGPPLTEDCHEGQHQACDGRTVDGFRCGCVCHDGEPEEL